MTNPALPNGNSFLLEARVLYMGGNLLTVQSMEMMSYLFVFLATVFGNLEVWKVRK